MQSKTQFNMKDKKINLATTQTITSNYVGEASNKLVAAAFKEADTLRLNLLTTVEGVKFKRNLRKIAYTDGTTDYTCGFTPAGAVTLSEKVVTPKKVMNPGQLCKDDYKQQWSASLLGPSAHQDMMPSDVKEALLQKILGETGSKVDDEIWQGVNATDGQIGDGFITQWGSDGSIIKDGNGVTGPGHSVSESTVQADIKLALAAIPIPLRRRNDLVVGVSPDVFQAYQFKMVSLGQANDGTSEPKQAKFGKYTLTEINGLPADTIIVYAKENMEFCTDLVGDTTRIDFSDEDEMGLLTGQVRFKIVYSGGMGYYNSAEIVWLLLTT